MTSLDPVTRPHSARARRRTGGYDPSPGHPIGTPTKGITTNTGPLATAAWLVARELTPPGPRWYVEILLGSPDSTLLRVELFSEEWGFFLRHDGKESWIRVTDVPFVHGRDEHGLLAETPALSRFGSIVRAIESRFGIELVSSAAEIRSSILGADEAILRWIASW